MRPLLSPATLSGSLHALYERVDAHQRTLSLAMLEAECRLRLRLRPYLLDERLLLAMCLSEGEETLSALVEWDEALHTAERSHDWPMLEGCFYLMGTYHPAEALSILDRSPGSIPEMTREWLRATLLEALGRYEEAEKMIQEAISRPWSSWLREPAPSYGISRTHVPATCDPTHLPARPCLVS